MADNRLGELRKKKGYSQVRIQTETGIDQSDYSKMERGIRYPNFDQCCLLSRLFDTSIDYIFGYTDDPSPYPLPSESGKKRP
ncbi:MAG: helix-turn-helix domain-containing protein [Emergencia sp.]